jgi:hypothetical protein
MKNETGRSLYEYRKELEKIQQEVVEKFLDNLYAEAFEHGWRRGKQEGSNSPRKDKI